MDWQQVAALLVVVLAALLLLRRQILRIRRAKNGACGADCECGQAVGGKGAPPFPAKNLESPSQFPYLSSLRKSPEDGTWKNSTLRQSRVNRCMRH